MFAKSMTLTKDDIDRAFAEREFKIVLQPQVNIADGAVTAAEAFVRWDHPRLGMMTPQLFLPAIDAHGESPRLLDTVVRLALGSASAFRMTGYDWRVSINLGAADLQTGVAPDVIAAALQGSRATAADLIVEAPESALIDGGRAVQATLERLRAMGCRVALDSGAGLPAEAAEAWPELFSEIKVGGAAILRFAEIARKVDGGRIARRLAFAQRHGLHSVAVGVEKERTLQALVRLGFDAVQGAMVMKPLALEDLLAWDGAWRGEDAETPLPAAAPRPRPRLVKMAPPAPQPEPLAGPSAFPEAAAPKLVEQLRPAPTGFDFGEIDDDPLDVDFDDDGYEHDDRPVRAENPAPEQDPSDDLALDGEELNALETAAPLHAGMIERPKLQRAALRVPVSTFVQVDEPEPAEADEAGYPLIDRPLALRIKAPPPQTGMFSRLGKLLGR
ncbi:MAG: EAL domain-containing protein [Alphaproteobacteria bacterium]|nr:EAL domain-containing protein [Alphaproteobacteria bacterium]